MPWAILDTSVYIDHWERGLYEADLTVVRERFVVRYSAVVLSELRRGARTAAARRLVEALYRLAWTLWTPTAGDWWEAGHVVRTIGDREHWDDHKRRGFQNDALIALTARRHGATVITADRRDFELLSRALRIRVLAVGPGSA
jgi:predicted nucleic acid-binding protein